MDLAKLEATIFKDLSYLKEKVCQLEQDKILNECSSFCKVIEIIDDKSIVEDRYGDIYLLDRKFEIEQYIYYDSYDKVLIPIKNEVIKDKEALKILEDMAFEISDLRKLNILEFNKESILKLKQYLDKEKEEKEKKEAKEKEAKRDKNAIRIWKEKGIYNDFNNFKIKGKEIEENNKVVCKADKEFNKILDFEDLENKGDYIDTIDFLTDVCKEIEEIIIDWQKCKIEVKEFKVYIDDVKIPKNKLKSILNKYGDEIKTKEDLEIYVKLTEMKISLLNQKSITICGIGCDIETGFIDKKRVKIKFLGFEKERNWDDVKKILFYGRRTIKDFSYGDEWYKLLELLDVDKQEFLDKLKKIATLNKLEYDKGEQ